MKNSAEYYIEELDKIGIDLLSPFSKAKNKHILKCKKCSNIWDTSTISSILQLNKIKPNANGCKKCAADRGKKANISHDYRKIFKEYDIDINSLNINSKTISEFICNKCNHKWKGIPCQVFSNFERSNKKMICPNCSIINKKDVQILNYLKIFNEAKIQLLEESKDINEYHKVKCLVCNNIFSNTLKNIYLNFKRRATNSCPLCYKENQSANSSPKNNSYDIEVKLKRINIILLEPFTRMKLHHKLKCDVCNHEWKSTLSSLFQRNKNATNHNGCPNCNLYRMRHSTEDFISMSNKIHNNKYDYSKSVYTTNKNNIIITCPIHGDFEQRAEFHLNGSNCPKCSSMGVSKHENEIYEFLKSECNFQMEQHNKKLLNGKELDIVFIDKKIAIEYDGIYWHSELNGKDKNYHLNKTKICNEIGYKLIHVFENEWVFKQDIVKSRLLAKLGIFKNTYYARKCDIRELSDAEYKEFLENNHLQGYAVASKRYGLVYDNELVLVMGFSKSRHNPSYEYELIRFASKLNTIVVGGGSKLFKHFIKTETPKSVISYSDIRWNHGLTYEKIGMSKIKTSEPNFWYFLTNGSCKLYNRLTFQKHKLKDKLELYDEKLTAYENMLINGYNRIWDCGNDVYIWTSLENDTMLGNSNK